MQSGLGNAPVSAEIILKTKPFRTVMDVKKAVARRFGLTVSELENGSRDPRFSRPRQVALAICWKRLRKYGYTLNRICSQFPGETRHGLHHSTLLFAARKFGIQPDPEMSARGRRARCGVGIAA